jgi:hypothetical protein
MGACILIFLACKAKVKSFFKLVIFLRATHAFGLSLYCMTVGPT